MRTLREKVGVDAPVRQFRSFGQVDRDPRMRIVSIGYMALLTHAQVEPLVDDTPQLATLRDGVWRGLNGRRLALAFDHDAIVAAALAHLRADLDHSAWSYGLLPPAFSLRELQQMHEAVRGRSLNKPAFRKRLVESGWIEPTGELETDKGFRPADLYRVASEHRDVSTPAAAFEQAWRRHGPALRSWLRAGFDMLVRCKGGLGRVGSVAARLLVDCGCRPADALGVVRAVRPGAVETLAHERYVHSSQSVVGCMFKRHRA